MKKYVVILVIQVILIGVAYYVGKSNKTDEDIDEKDMFTWGPTWNPSEITFADTAAIMDSIQMLYDCATSSNKVAIATSEEIELRMAIDNLELEETNKKLPPRLRYDNSRFKMFIDIYAELMREHHKKMDEEDPWVWADTEYDVLIAIKEHTERLREERKAAESHYHGDDFRAIWE